ncbi:MAG: ABC transporter permease [Acidobacteriota bacterium]
MRRFRFAVGFFVLLHVVVLAAGVLAPHDPTTQNRRLSFAPPTTLHWIDADGGFHWRPFVYRLEPDPQRPGGWREDPSQRFPLRLRVPSEPRQLGPWTAHHRWLGVDPPAAFHPLGTDRFGRDVASRLLHGARRSLFAGFAAAWLAILVGSTLGVVAGFYGGRVDRVLMRGTELALALPWLYLLLGVRAALPLDVDPSRALVLLVLLVGLLAWAIPARMVRGETLAIRERESVLAARGFGAGDLHLIRHHVVPAIAPTVLTQWALLTPQCVLAEATLSFFGLGAAEPHPSLGTLLSADQALLALDTPVGLFAPAVTLALVVLSYHLLANAFPRSPIAFETDAATPTG